LRQEAIAAAAGRSNVSASMDWFKTSSEFLDQAGGASAQAVVFRSCGTHNSQHSKSPARPDLLV